jgi:Flp pilus assembly protein TadG
MPFLRRAARRFSRDDGGNIAVLFGIALVPILTFVGAAVDYSRANAARSSMQAALDSATLMLSRDLAQATITTGDIPAAADKYFKALYTSKDAPNPTVTATYSTDPATGSHVVLTANGQITTAFMNIIGFPTMSFSSSSTSTWGNAKMRVALVLDNTGSMNSDNKMTALKNAVAGTGGLIDQLSNLAKNPGDVYISVVPFAKDVNLGSGSYAQSWIDWTDWLNPPTQQPNNGTYQASLPINWHAVGPGAKCPFSNSNGGFTCLASPTSNPDPSVSGVSTIPSSGYICPSFDANSHTRYNGCWVSTSAGTGVFCSGSNSCSCPLNSSGTSISGCSCSGTGSSKSCTGNLYDHNWTQPGPNDTTHNTNQPRVGAVVGWTNHKYTATSPTPTVVNAWNQVSTNPIDTWSGCITDRSQPNDATAVLPTSDVTTMFPANEYYENTESYCANNNSPQLKPIIPLSYSWSTLKTAINAMQPTGGTNQAVGLAWGVQSLIPGGVLNAPTEDPSTTYTRVVILLSDGLNTEDRWPANGNGTSQASGNPIDSRQALLCTNLKNTKDSKGVSLYTIYTIQVNTHSPADPTSTVLQNCASSPDQFYMLTSSTEILTTFQSIGTALSKLRVSK